MRVRVGGGSWRRLIGERAGQAVKLRLTNEVLPCQVAHHGKCYKQTLEGFGIAVVHSCMQIIVSDLQLSSTLSGLSLHEPPQLPGP